MYEPELRALGDRFRGAFLGAALGDALGLPFEGTPAGGLDQLRDLVEHRAARPRSWSFSDDTQMMLDLARSLWTRGGLDRGHALAALREGYDPARGYGKGMKLIFRAMDQGADLDSLAQVAWPEGSRGNGGVVRLPPLACFYHRHEALSKLARDSCSWTHAHPRAVSASAIFAAALDELLGLPAPQRFDRDAFLSRARAAADDELLDDRLGAIAALIEDGQPAREVVAVLGHDVLAEASVPAALYALCLGDGFEGTVKLAVGLGGDTDSIGAMAGALAGARYGAAAIPKRWAASLEERGRDQLLALADGILERWVARITGLA